MSVVDTQFQNAALASGLVSTEQMDYVLRLARHRLTANGKPSDAVLSDRMLADILVEQSNLTNYQADQLLQGRTKFSLGPYIITDFIGQGGMGQVFRAVHRVMGRECAVKVLPLHRATPESLQSFNREIRLQAKLDCPYLVRAFDAGQDGNVHYLVTEYVPGMDLRRLVKTRGPLSIQQAASIIMQAALGLQYAHDAGMIHRDVKPGNILVTPEGVVKVSDVGLASFAVDLLNDPRAGKIVGTADYLSPEQIRTPMEVTSTSDIYSLGCTLYYAICGKVPFPGGDTQSKIRRHLQETPWHPRRFKPELTEEFIDVIADMMEKNPRERVQTCEEVAIRLEPWAGEVSEIGSTRMSRGPWMAPPPPALDLAVEVSPNLVTTTTGEGALDSTGLSQEASQATQRPYDALRSLPDFHSNPPFPGLVTNPVGSTGTHSLFPGTSSVSAIPRSPNLSRGMIVALTIAIVVPPSLALGAILGYLLFASQSAS